MRNGIGATIATGTAVAGTLDLLSAFVFAGMKGVGPVQVLRGVAAGPFGDAMHDGGPVAALLGLAVHYSIMAVMVTVFVFAARRVPFLTQQAVVAGALYGLGLYFVMYWGVLALRYPQAFPQTGLWQVSNALFSHLICVGIPIALVTRRAIRRG